MNKYTLINIKANLKSIKNITKNDFIKEICKQDIKRIKKLIK